MLEIKQVSFKNFFSYSENEYQVSFVNNTPLLISGENGAGKSTIFEAVIWGLFGSTLKNVAADSVVNLNNNKDCRVTVSGTIDSNTFKITRYRKDSARKNYVEFEINNIVNVGESNAGTQTIINDTLKLDYESFLYTCYFNPSLTDSFAGLGDKKQKVIIEQLIKSDTWDLCYLNATNRLSNLTKKRDKLISERVAVSGKKEVAQKSVIDLLSLVKQSSLKGVEDNIRKNKKLIKKHTEDQKKIKNASEKAIISANKFSGISQKYQVVATHLHVAKQGKCRHCMRDLKLSETDLNRLKHKAAYLKQSIQLAESESRKDDEEFRRLRSLYGVISTLCAELESFEAMHEMASNTKAILDKTKRKVLDYTKHVKLLTEAVNLLEKEIKVLTSVKELAGPRGARVYALNHLVPHLNKSLKRFCNELSEDKMGVTLSFDQKSGRCRVLCEFGHVMEYSNCSSGQARRVDLCIMLAFLELLKYLGKNTNFLILDEFLDTLDKKGVEKTLEILYSLNYDNIFIISHNAELMDIFENKLLVAQDTKGFSHFAERPG